MQRDPDIGKATPYYQFTSLVLKPLEKLVAWAFSPTTALVLVLDGLDECGSESTRLPLRSTLRELNCLPDFVKIFITSRPTRDLQALFDSMGSQVEHYNLSDIPRAEVDCDIAAFIRARMFSISHLHEALHGSESVQTCKSLTQKSAGSFYGRRGSWKDHGMSWQ